MTRRTLLTDTWAFGIDLHKDTLFVVGLDPRTGQTTQRRLTCRCRNQIIEYFSALPRPHSVAIESMGSYRWLYNLLEPILDELLLADATQARALAGRRIKTDFEDALNLAELLVAGQLPIAWVPSAPVARLRDWTRHRNGLSQKHAGVLHRVHTLLQLNNRPGPARMSSEGLIRYLKGQGHLLPEDHVEQLWQAVDHLTLLEHQILQAERRLRDLLDQEEFRAAAELLQTMNGVGLVVAATVLAEIGDFSRFDDREAIVCYAGLHPRVFASGGTCRTGHIAKTGSPQLRWVLVQAAWSAVRCDGHVRKIWPQIRKRAGGKKAIVAVARRMLIWMWAMVRDGKPYRHAA